MVPKNHLKVYKFRGQRIAVLHGVGTIDLLTIPMIERYINLLKEKRLYKFIIDFREVELVTSAGWGLFIGELKDFVKEGGDIRFCNMNQNVLDSYNLLELGLFFLNFSDLDESIKSFSLFPESQIESHKKIHAKISKLGFPKSNKQEFEENQLRQSENIKLKREITVLKSEIKKLVSKNAQFLEKINELSKSQNNQPSTDMGVNDIIKVIVKKYPNFGPRRIKLKLLDYNCEQISVSTIYRRLRMFKLNIKENRIRFSEGLKVI